VYDAKDDPGRGGAMPISGSVTTWMVRNKIDLMASNRMNEYRNKNIISDIEFSLSASTGLGLADFLAHLTKYAISYFGPESALLSRERHRKLLELARNALDRVLGETSTAHEELVAEELRTAAQALGRLTGRVDVEDILDAIFRDFCIGK
jgi:tRNA modification GTPase